MAIFWFVSFVHRYVFVSSFVEQTVSTFRIFT